MDVNGFVVHINESIALCAKKHGQNPFLLSVPQWVLRTLMVAIYVRTFAAGCPCIGAFVHHHVVLAGGTFFPFLRGNSDLRTLTVALLCEKCTAFCPFRVIYAP